MNNTISYSVWKTPLKLLMLILVVLVILTFGVMLGEFLNIGFKTPATTTTKSNIINPDSSRIEADSLRSYLNVRLDFVEKSISEAKSDIVKICDSTVSVARDLIALLTFIVALVALVATYRIKSIELELITKINPQLMSIIKSKEEEIKNQLESIITQQMEKIDLQSKSNIDLQVQSKFNEFEENLKEELMQIKAHKAYFDYVRWLRSSDKSKIRMAANYFFGRRDFFKQDPYVIAGLQQAIATIQDHSIESFLHRVHVTLDELNALDELIQRYQEVADQDKEYYKVAFRGLVSDGIEAVEARLKRDKIWEEIMS